MKKEKKIKAVKGWAVNDWKKIVAVYLTKHEANMWVIYNPSVSCKIIPILITPLRRAK